MGSALDTLSWGDFTGYEGTGSYEGMGSGLPLTHVEHGDSI